MALNVDVTPRRLVPVTLGRRLHAGHLRDQVGVGLGHAVAGVGNLLFVVVLARVLDPAAFSQAAAFLALYLLVHAPASSLSAGAALAPDASADLRRGVVAVGAGAALLLAAAAVPAATLLDLPVAMVGALAAAVPLAGVLALERGRLYGQYAYGGVVASLVTEPVVRLTLGVVLALSLGALGAGAGVVVAGYLALGAALLWPAPRSGERAVGVDAPVRAKVFLQRSAPVVIVFLLLAVVQGQALVAANALLPSAEAARFAAAATFGNLAMFATATIPLVLIPRAVAGQRRALPVALALAAAIGAAVVGVSLVAAGPVLGLLLGARYTDAASLAPVYVTAMALLGCTRVLVAARTARGGRWLPVGLLGAATALQAGLILLGPRTASAIAVTTLVSTVVLASGAAVMEVVAERRAVSAGRRAAAPSDTARTRRWRPLQPATVAVAVATLLALGIRLIVTRGLWLDEATSAAMAQLPWDTMIERLRYGDVHPPAHYALLWGVVRLIGTDEMALRLPSLITGVALVPAMYALARACFDRTTGVLAGFLTAVAPIPVWYAQEARMYAPFLLFAVLALLGQVRAIQRGGWQDWTLYAAATVGMLWFQYFGILPMLVQQGVFAVVAWKRRADLAALASMVLRWGLATVAVVLAVLPIYPIITDQMVAYANRGVGLNPVPGAMGGTRLQTTEFIYTVGANAVWGLWGYHPPETMVRLVALWPLMMLLALLVLGRRPGWPASILLAVALLPPLALLGVVRVRPDLFELRYFIAAVPAMLVLLARLVVVSTAGRARVVVASLVAATLVVGLVDQQINVGQPRRYDFQGALADASDLTGPDDIVFYEPWYLEDLVEYYAPELNAYPLRERAFPDEYFDGTVVVLGSFLEQPAHAERAGAAVGYVEYLRGATEVREYANVSLWLWREGQRGDHRRPEEAEK